MLNGTAFSGIPAVHWDREVAKAARKARRIARNAIPGGGAFGSGIHDAGHGGQAREFGGVSGAELAHGAAAVDLDGN